MNIVAGILQNWYKKGKSILGDEKKLSMIFVGFTLLCILPMYLIGGYAHPSTDDYSFAYHSYQAARSTDGLMRPLAVMGGALRAVRDAYFQWSGYYTGSLLAALRPNFYNENLAFLNSFVILTVLIAGIYAGVKKIMTELFGLPACFGRAVSCIALLLSIQLVPSAAEGFYWYTAAITYTLLFAAALLLLTRYAVSLYAAGEHKESKRGNAWNLFLAALTAGGILPVNIPVLGIMTAMLLDGFFSKKHPAGRKLKIQLLSVWLVFLAGMVIGSLSPSTFWRLDNLEGSVSLAGALIYSAYGTVMTAAGFLTPYVILAAMVLAVLSAFYMSRTSFRFEHPFFVLLVSFCVMYGAYFPIYFGTGFKLQYADSRYKNILFFHFVILLCINAVYWTGWLYQRQQQAGEKKCGRKTALVFALTGILLLCLADKDAPKELWSVRAVKDMASGTVQQYDSQMDARYGDFLNPDLKTVTLTPPSVVSNVIFLGEPEKGEEGSWVVEAMRRYYGKEAIILPD